MNLAGLYSTQKPRSKIEKHIYYKMFILKISGKLINEIHFILLLFLNPYGSIQYY